MISGSRRVETLRHLVAQVLARKICDLLPRGERDGAAGVVASAAEAEDGVPRAPLGKIKALGLELLVHPREHLGGGGAADPVVDVCGQDDAAESMVESKDTLVIERGRVGWGFL